MYADDTHLTYAGDNVDNIQLHLNQDLENVHNWLRANKLTLNMTKTKFMLIGSRQRLSTLTESPTFAMGPLHDPVTWYKIIYTGEQIAQWDLQNKGRSR